MGKRKFIVDCDVGTDDAQAILMLLSKYQQDVEVLAITAVFGNAPLENTAHNALRVLKVCDRLDIPVYRGCDKPLVGGPLHCDGFHGKDGMGDVESMYPVSKDLLQKERASEALVRLVTEHAGEVTLVTLGPLTNLAVALHLDGQFGQKLKDFVIMGGNIYGRGNITTCAEFNFRCDPESASFVLNNLGKVCTIIPLEPCYEFSFEWDWYEKYVSLPTEKAAFVRNIDKAVLVSMKNFKADKYWAWDQLAMAVALDDKIVTEKANYYVTVELHGELTRGQMVVDRNGILKKSPNAVIVNKVDINLYKKYMIQAVDYDGDLF